MIVGEFLRRHHARLAHEIAFNGVPGVHGQTIPLYESNHSNLTDLCGFIARSHNLGLREAVDHLPSNKRRQHLSVHSPYIMLVLRISDYIQIHSERADQQLLKIKHIVSPISKGEWDKHKAIIDITHTHDDPEAIYIDAEPDNAITFTQLQYLFASIQKELDQSWSVLGEVYGRMDKLNSLGINIRRIRSSLDNLSEFIKEKKPSYIPKMLAFKTANSEMIELLISPLYGDSPNFGVRELLQNSIDACIELNDLVEKQKISLKEIRPEFDVKVTLDVASEENPRNRIVIQDSGIGMTLDVVENYFLNVGASFRNSDGWKKNHVNKGNSTVHRTGRFGIGLLAAYLLGDKINVVTRHVSASRNEALSFSCEQDSNQIEVTNVEADIGTTITIDIPYSVAKRLSEDTNTWDWYCSEQLRVIRKVVYVEESDKEVVCTQKHTLPSCNSLLPEYWNRTEHNDYDDILWSYNYTPKHRYSHYRLSILACNSIIVSESNNIYNIFPSPELNKFRIECPNLVIYDQNGRLPLNLERTSLNDRSPSFISNVVDDVCKSITYSVVDSVSKINNNSELFEYCTNPKLLPLSRNYYNDESCTFFIINQNNLIPLDYQLIQKANVQTLTIDPRANLEEEITSYTEFKGTSDYYAPILFKTKAKTRRTSLIKEYFINFFKPINRNDEFTNPVIGSRIILNKDVEKEMLAPGYLSKQFWNRLTTEWENDEWVIYSLGDIPVLHENYEDLTQLMSRTDRFCLIQLSFDWSECESHEVSKIYTNWLSVIGQPELLLNNAINT